MEKVEGMPLENLWYDKKNKTEKLLTDPEREQILEQIAQFVAEMQNSTFDKIGSFRFREEIGDKFGLNINLDDISVEDIIIGQHTDIYAGPFHSYTKYEQASMNYFLDKMKAKQVVQSNNDLIPDIEKFINKIDKIIHIEEPENTKFTLIHGDLEPRNIIVDPNTMCIKAVVDWEFSGLTHSFLFKSIFSQKNISSFSSGTVL